MNPKITVELTETIPDDASVRHYDELEHGAKQRFPNVVEHGEQNIDVKTALQFRDGEFVKYTDYYRVLLA
ncbi:hypothetical protein [Haladaptatus halobius]|uniref:hypothetical protein n=1 Tax=Haladaptatus halobius TaxID=2884875 RepID=UPI001D0A9A88|nr:hypothetical protein [Haladaptatus halobius]